MGVEHEILDDARIAVAAGHAQDSPNRAGLDELDTVGRELALLIAVCETAMTPRVGRVVDDRGARTAGRQEARHVHAVLAEHERGDSTGLRGDLEPEPVVLEAGRRGSEVSPGGPARIAGHPVRPIAEGRHVRLERDPRPPRLDRRVGLDLLDGDRIPALVEQPVGRPKPAIFELDRRPHRPRVGIEDDHRDDSRGDRQVDEPTDRLDGHVVCPSGDRRGFTELVAGIDVGGLDGRSAERVVELVEQDLLPGPNELGSRIAQRRHRARDDRPRLGGRERALRPAHPALHARMRGVTADGVVLEIAVHDGDRSVRFEHRVEESARRAVDEAWHRAGPVELADAVEIRTGRAAAMVSDAVERHHLGPPDGELGDRLVEVVAEVLVRGAVLVRQTEGEDSRATRRFPPEHRCRKPELVRTGSHEDIAVHAAPAQDLGKHRVVPERIDVVADRRNPAELLEEVALGDQRLADKGFAARDVAIGLDPPAADELPAALGDAFPDLLEHPGIDLLDPFVVRRRVAGEDELRVLVHPVQGGPEGRADLLVALLPLPQPDRIDVRVADQVEGSGGDRVGFVGHPAAQGMPLASGDDRPAPD